MVVTLDFESNDLGSNPSPGAMDYPVHITLNLASVI